MKSRFRQKLLLGLMLFTALFSLVPSRVFAVSGTIYFTPGGGSVINGSEFDIEVRGNVASPAPWGGGTTTIVSYDASKLEVVSRDDTGGAFAGANTKNWNGTTAGTVKYVAQYYWNAPGVKDQKIIHIKFKAIATGTVNLSFASGTSINDGPTTGTPSAFTILAPTCPAGQIGTPPNCTTPAPSPTPKPSTKPSNKPTPVVTPAPTPTPTVEETPAPVVSSDGGLKIEDVKVTASRAENSVTWSLNNAAAKPTVLYGTNKNTLQDAGEVTKLEDGSYKLAFKDLKLGTLYYFTIKASTDDNLLGASYSGVLTTRGYPVQLTIKQNNVLIEGATVVIGGRTFKTNANSVVTAELSDGKFTAAITPTGSADSQKAEFTVKKLAVPANGNPETQSFTLNIETLNDRPVESNDSSLTTIIGTALGLLALSGAIFGFFIFRRKKQEEQSQPQSIDVDTAQLQQAYGRDVKNFMTNTPEPNLEGGFATTGSTAPASAPIPDPNPASAVVPPVAELPPSMPEPQVAPPLPVEIPAAAPLDAAVIAPVSAPVAVAPPPDIARQPMQFDPSLSSAPLPSPISDYTTPPQDLSANTSAPLQAAPADTLPQQIVEPAAISDNPALAQDITRVESSEQPTVNPDEPSAVYDAATGELAIIHHRGGAPQGGAA